jgi:hypothetical protein
MKQFLSILFLSCFGFFSCSSGKKGISSAVNQGVTGHITEVRGNQMPLQGIAPSKPKGILTTVFVYEPTNISQVTRIGSSALYTAISTKLVASVITDSSGAFTLALPAGSYSIFIKQGNRFYANLFDTNNNIAPFTVEIGKLTKVNLSVNSSATY